MMFIGCRSSKALPWLVLGAQWKGEGCNCNLSGKILRTHSNPFTWQLLEGDAEILPGPGLGDGNIPPPIGGDLQNSSFVSAGRNWSVVGKLLRLEELSILEDIEIHLVKVW